MFIFCFVLFCFCFILFCFVLFCAECFLSSVLFFFLLARESRFFFIFPCMNSSKLKMDAVFSLLCSAHSLDFSEVFLSRCFLLYPPCRIPLEWLSYFQNVERWRWGLYTTQTFLSPHQRMVSILQSEAQSTVMWTAHSPFRLCVLTSLFVFCICFESCRNSRFWHKAFPRISVGWHHSIQHQIDSRYSLFRESLDKAY